MVINTPMVMNVSYSSLYICVYIYIYVCACVCVCVCVKKYECVVIYVFMEVGVYMRIFMESLYYWISPC